MLCPYCDSPLEYEDYYGRLCAHQDGKVLGEIYKCPNEECESGVFNYFFYTSGEDGDLLEGYPC